MKKVKWILLGIAVPLLLIIGYYSYSLLQFGLKIHQASQKAPVVTSQPGSTTETDPKREPVAPAVPEWDGKERVNILLLGGDGRSESDAGRSDAILLLSVDPVSKQAQLFSILRDTYVDIPGHGRNKINAALAFGGPELAIQTVSNFVGMPVHYYFYVGLEAFVKLVDALGGIDNDVEKDMKYTDTSDKEALQINLKKGYQHLDGNKALQYVRFRHDAMSDYTRTERQRKFLKAVAEQVQSASTIFNLPRILDQTAPYISTNMTIGDMLKMAALGYQIKNADIAAEQLPPMDLLKEDTINGASVIVVEKDRLKQYLKTKLDPTSNADR